MRRFLLLTVLLSGCSSPPLVCDDPEALPVRAAGLDVIVRPPSSGEPARGTALLFHGLGESACTWADRVEGHRISERLRSEGWFVIAPDSGPNQSDWSTAWPENADVAALDEALSALDHPELDLSAPSVAVGHSNGGTFAPIWADRGMLDSRAVVVANGWGSEALSSDASPPPLLFIRAVNDLVVPPALTEQAVRRSQNAGHEAEQVVNEPQPVLWTRFARIPGIDEAGSRAMHDSLRDAGLLDDDDVLRTNPRLDRSWEDAIPAELAEHRGAIEEQLHVLYAEHRFSSDNAERILRFVSAASSEVPGG